MWRRNHRQPVENARPWNRKGSGERGKKKDEERKETMGLWRVLGDRERVRSCGLEKTAVDDNFGSVGRVEA
jgi:hypothetical protein